MTWFGCILAALFFVSLFGDDRCIKAAAGTLFGNWVANTAMAFTLGTQTVWPITASIDWASAVLLIVACTGPLRLLIGGTYAMQMIVHAAYGVLTALNTVTYRVEVTYWDSLFGLAILQAALVGGWIVGGGFGRRRLSRRSGLPHTTMPVFVVRGGNDKR